MPKYRPETAEAKAKKLTRLYLSTRNLSKAEVARKLGTSRQNITNQIKKKPVQDCINAMLDDQNFKDLWIAQGLAGLSAEKAVGLQGTLIPDHCARHKYWHDLGVAMKIVKPNGNGGDVRVINIIHAYDRDKSPTSSVRDSERSSQ